MDPLEAAIQKDIYQFKKNQVDLKELVNKSLFDREIDIDQVMGDINSLLEQNDILLNRLVINLKQQQYDSN
jgi:hypothetical protein